MADISMSPLGPGVTQGIKSTGSNGRPAALHSRCKSVPHPDIVPTKGLQHSTLTGLSGRSPPRSTSSRDRKRTSLPPSRRGDSTKIQQVFFPPFEETSSEGESCKEEVENPTSQGWAKLFSNSTATTRYDAGASRHSQRAKSPNARPTRHRRTQSSIETTGQSKQSTFHRPSGIALAPLDTEHISPPRQCKSSPLQQVIASKQTQGATSPLTRRARRVLGEIDPDNMTSPTEECPGGKGMFEAIRLHSLAVDDSKIVNVDMVIDNEELGTVQLHRSASMPNGRNKRKAVIYTLGNRYPTTGPILRFRPETIEETTKPRNRPPRLRNLPPPSWSSPGPSPPLTSLATPFSTELFSMPYPNPVTAVLSGVISLDLSPPSSPFYSTAQSVPLTSRHDPMEDVYEQTQPRIRRRSSLASFESTTETIRPWHVGLELTPKANRTQLRSISGASIKDPAGSNKLEGLQLETLVCDWDLESDDEQRGRTGKKARVKADRDRDSQRMRDDPMMVRGMRKKSDSRRSRGSTIR